MSVFSNSNSRLERFSDSSAVRGAHRLAPLPRRVPLMSDESAVEEINNLAVAVVLALCIVFSLALGLSGLRRRARKFRDGFVRTPSAGRATTRR